VASFSKRSRDPDHSPFGKNVFTLGVGLAIVDPLAKFNERSFIHSRYIEGALKFLKASRDPDHANFFK